jgi:uncharacterized protein
MAGPARSEAQVATPKAQRYLAQLCKHFEHRLSVYRWDVNGTIAFPAGLCRLEAAPDRLVLKAEAPDPQQLAELEGVVTRHLARFAFRDPPTVEWRRLSA